MVSKTLRSEAGGHGEGGLRPVLVCADDFGLAPGVNAAIAQLIALGRLSATGCMSLMPDWHSGAPLLREALRQSPADVGLHLTLTDQRPLRGGATLAPQGQLMPLPALMRAAFSGHLSQQELRAEIEAQLDAFELEWGGPPDFVDGHQHVHVLPGIRGCVLDILGRRYRGRTVYVRHCGESPARILGRGGAVLKALIIAGLSAGFARAVGRAGFSCNMGFSGLHDFSGGIPFRHEMRRFMSHPGPRPMIHVHPGRVDETLCRLDSLTDARERELAYLASPDYVADLAEAGLRVARFAEFGRVSEN